MTRFAKIATMIAVAAAIIVGVSACGSDRVQAVKVPESGAYSPTAQGIQAQPTGAGTKVAPSSQVAPPPQAAPKPNDKLPMRVIRERVRAILTANVDHYAKLLAAGEQALGSTQYTNADAGLAAFNDPDSAASKFRDYQGGQGGGPTNDLSFIDAFRQADSYYTAADEPTSAITAWRNDISNAQAGFNQFTTVGTGWQISQYTTAQLRSAERQIADDLAKARRDIAEIVASN